MSLADLQADRDRSSGNRRDFLKFAGVGLCSAALTGPNASAFTAERPQRNGKPHFKLSLAAYSVRDYLTGPSPG